MSKFNKTMKSNGQSQSEMSAPVTKKIFRMPQTRFSKPKTQSTFSLPIGFKGAPSLSSSEESTDDEKVAIMERDKLEIERIRKRRMYEKGMRCVTRKIIPKTYVCLVCIMSPANITIIMAVGILSSIR